MEGRCYEFEEVLYLGDSQCHRSNTEFRRRTLSILSGLSLFLRLAILPNHIVRLISHKQSRVDLRLLNGYDGCIRKRHWLHWHVD